MRQFQKVDDSLLVAIKIALKASLVVFPFALLLVFLIRIFVA